MINSCNTSVLNSRKGFTVAANYLRQDCVDFGLDFADTVQDLIGSNGLNLCGNDGSHFVQAGDVDWSIEDFDHSRRLQFHEDNSGEGAAWWSVIEFDRYGNIRKTWVE